MEIKRKRLHSAKKWPKTPAFHFIFMMSHTRESIGEGHSLNTYDLSMFAIVLERGRERLWTLNSIHFEHEI